MTKRRQLNGDRRLRPVLSIPLILAWADAYHKRSGKWPKKTSGRIGGALGDTWTAVEMALRGGGAFPAVRRWPNCSPSGGASATKSACRA